MSPGHSSSIAVQQLGSAEGVRYTPVSEASAATLGGEERPFVRLDLGRSLQLHRKLALVFALCGLALAVAYVAKSWPVYTAESQIYVQPAPPGVLAQGNERTWPFDSNTYDSYIQQQVQNASNPAVLLDALHKLDPGSWQKDGESEESAAGRIGNAIEVSRLGTSYEIAITARAKTAQMAAAIANAMAESLVERASHQQNAGDTQRMAILRDERGRVQNQLNADLAEQTALNQQLGMASVGTTSPDLIDNAIGTTHEELIKARTAHDEAAARFAALGAAQGTASTALQAEADEIVAADAGLTSMKTSLNQRRAILISQMANLTPDNPAYRLNAEELAKINGSLDAMMADLRNKAATRIQSRLRTDLERTAGVEAQLNGQLRQLSATAAGATPKLQRASDLAADIVRLRTRYASVDEELNNIQLKDNIPGAVHLSVAAVAPLHPTVSGVARKALPLAFGGILLGLLAALIANNLDQKIYIASDVEHIIGSAPMAALPSFAEVSDVAFDEHLLRLTAAIERALEQGSLKSCVLTGTGPGTGVTTVASRLHEMLEGMGRSTVLVDALGHSHRAPGAGGAREAAEESAAQRGGRSAALLQKVTEEARLRDESVVLTDTAPLTISAETECVARFADCVIVVLESGVTTRAQLRATAQMLQRMNVPAAGFVLNRVRLSTADRSFRDSVSAVERHVRSQRRTAMRRTAHTHHETAPSPQAIAAPAAAASQGTPAGEAATTHGPLPPSVGMPQMVEELNRLAAKPGAEAPWWLGAAGRQTAEPFAEPARPETGARQAPAPFSAEPAEEAREDTAHTTASRLSGLRSMRFAMGLNQLRTAGQANAEPEMRAPAAPAKEAATPRTYVPYPEPELAGEPRAVTAAPEFLPPQPEATLGKEYMWEGETPHRNDRRDAFDDLDILPSWRGQYRKKD